MAFPRKWRLLAIGLLGVYLVWLAAGIFPASPLEGDEQGVINGATARARGETDYVGMSYLPEIQPGSYLLLAGASRCTGVSVETLFAVGTATGAALFAGLAAGLIARVLHLPFWIALFGMLWCQEISAAAYYMNTTALGMWLTFAALLLACRPPNWRTCLGMAVCLAVAGWIRIDCLLPAPAIPVLLFWASGDFRRTLQGTTIVAAGSTAACASLYYASGVTWTTLSTTYAGRGGLEGWWPTLRSLPLLLSPLLCVLLVGGVAILVFRREWKLIALIAAGCAATLPVYGTSLASTKYFYHLVPFLLLPALFAGRLAIDAVANAPARRRMAAAIAIALTLLADQVITLQTSTPDFRRYASDPVVAKLARLPGGPHPVSLVIGPGEAIPTADGFRLRGGALFAPWIWHREKSAMRSQLARLQTMLRDSSDVTLYYSGWLPYQAAVRTLRAEGFNFKSWPRAANTMSYSGEWRATGHRVELEYLPYRTSSYFDPAHRPANRTGTNTYFIGDLSGLQPITELADAGEWRPLWPEFLWNFITVYQRHLDSVAP